MSRSLRAPFFFFYPLVCLLESDLSPAIRSRFLVCVCAESDISPAIGSRFPVCVFFGSESDVSPAIGIRFPCLPVCVESDVSPTIGSRFPVWVLFGVRWPSSECSDSSPVREDTYA